MDNQQIFHDRHGVDDGFVTAPHEMNLKKKAAADSFCRSDFFLQILPLNTFADELL